MRHKLRISGSVVDVSVTHGTSGSARVTLDGQEHSVQDVSSGGGQLAFTFNGNRHSFSMLNRAGQVDLTNGIEYHQFQLVEPGLETTEDAGTGELNSQMPGTVLKLLHAPGSAVAKGDPLLILEAMKMEHEVCAPNDGVVTSYPFSEGDRVMPGDLLVEFEQSGAD